MLGIIDPDEKIVAVNPTSIILNPKDEGFFVFIISSGGNILSKTFYKDESKAYCKIMKHYRYIEKVTKAGYIGQRYFVSHDGEYIILMDWITTGESTIRIGSHNNDFFVLDYFEDEESMNIVFDSIEKSLDKNLINIFDILVNNNTKCMIKYDLLNLNDHVLYHGDLYRIIYKKSGADDDYKEFIENAKDKLDPFDYSVEFKSKDYNYTIYMKKVILEENK